ncbi:MAG TPA: thiamine pyrophosphate-binding protein [Solirubrobacteraceae bacterium]
MLADEYIVRYLASQGVERVYEVIGGMIARIVDVMGQIGEPRIVDCHHEQAAAFAAEGEARLTGVPGVAMATSGPGAINLLTGLGSCHFDSTPAVFITGQVNRAEQKGTRAIRQLGFQETDIVAMAAPIAKAAWRVEEPEDLPRLLGEAFLLARSGRPGPVLLDVPMDIQGAEIDDEIPSGPIPLLVEAPHFDGLDEILSDLARAERPLILAGGGVQAGRAAEALRAFAEAVGVPVVHSLMAVDALPYGHPLRVGMIGTYGNRWANIALGSCDSLLVLGSRLDIRQTGADVEAFKAGRTIHHVDVDPGELNNRVTGVRAVTGALSAFLAAAAEVAGVDAGDHGDWIAEIEEQRARWPDTAELRDVPGINPNVFMHALSGAAPADVAAYAVDVGQHQMWAAQSLELRAGTRFLTSGGMGAMGSGLPMALGAAFAAGGRPVVMVAGDGAFQLNLQEIQTVVRNRLPVKLVVLNNQCHGMVRQFQETYFDGRYQSTVDGYSTPDFARVAAAYGLASAAVSEADEVEAAVARLWADPAEPFLLEVAIDLMANAYPKIAFGRPMTEMEPFAKPVGLEST